MGAMAVFKGLKQRRRSRRIRRSRESATSIFTKLAERRRKAGRRTRRSRETVVAKTLVAAKQRRRSRRRSRESLVPMFAAKQRRRSRRSRRSREVVAKQRRRSRRSRRRSREVVAKQRRRSMRRSREVVAKQRRRSRRSRRGRRSRETFSARKAVSLVTLGHSLAERKRRRRARQGGIRTIARQSRRPYSAYMPRVRERGVGFFGLRQTNGTRKFVDLTKKAAIASIGTIAGRGVSNLLSKGLSRYAPSVSGRWVSPAVAAGATALLWWGGGQTWTPGVWSRNRELIALGAALHFVEEILGLVLPMVGLGQGRGGVLGEAIYGSSLGGACAHGQALGGCQYGCQWPAGTTPCPSPYQAPGLPPGTTVTGPNGTQVAVAGLGGCQYGCQWPAGTTPCPSPYQAPVDPSMVAAMAPSTNQPGPVSGFGLAGDMAVRKAGDAARDPVIGNMLAQRAGHAQSLMDSVGIGR